MRRSQGVNITRIAREAGLSIASVSRAMNGRNGVSEDVRRRVNELLRKHNYIGNNHLNREKRIAILQNSCSFGGYQTELYYGFTDAAAEHGIDFCSVIRACNDRRTLLEEIRELQCSGVIVILPAQFESDLPSLIDSELKVILIDSTPSPLEGEVGFVDHDAYAGSLEAVRHLTGLGHRAISYVRHPSRTLNHLQRYKAYEDGLREAGIVPEPGWVIQPGGSCEKIRGATKELLSSHPELTALMVTSDEVAPGAMRAAWELGKRIPDDLSLVGFDDLPQSCCFVPSLTTVRHPIYDIASKAIRELDLCLKDPGRPLPREVFPAPLVVRESTGKAPR